MAPATTPARGADELAAALGLKRARRIFLKNFEARVSMGVHEFEKTGRQRVLVNVDLYLDPDAVIEKDALEETVDYDFLRREIERLAASGHFHLQETFCERILAACLDKPGVIAARVSSEKPDVYPECESVGFEIFRVK
ncbi:MAG TPA: dihydroneopterin aldolase [Burkholderiales bacterium]|nr:dihydroneopterin aldolase [Burkholderiales bacterium]